MSLSKELKNANKGANWNYEEAITLINIWSDANVQDEFEKSRRNTNIYEKIAKEMVEAGYERNIVQCRRKIKSLRSDYFAVKKENSKSEKSEQSFQFFDAYRKALFLGPIFPEGANTPINRQHVFPRNVKHKHLFQK